MRVYLLESCMLHRTMRKKGRFEMLNYHGVGIVCTIGCFVKKRSGEALKWKNLVLAVAGVATTSFVIPQYPNIETVSAVYTVKSGDTLRDISEKFLPLNTASRVYILEFEHEIIEGNPELKADRTIYPGQQIKIEYKVRRD